MGCFQSVCDFVKCKCCRQEEIKARISEELSEDSTDMESSSSDGGDDSDKDSDAGSVNTAKSADTDDGVTLG